MNGTQLLLCGDGVNLLSKNVNITEKNESFNLLKPTDHVMHHQFNIQQLYVLPTLYLCIYLRTNSDLCDFFHLQHKLIGFYNRDEKCLQCGTDWNFKYSRLRFFFKGLIAANSELKLEVNSATTKDLLMSAEQNAGQNHNTEQGNVSFGHVQNSNLW